MDGDTKSAGDSVKGAQRARANCGVFLFAQAVLPIVAASPGVDDGLIGQPGFLHECSERGPLGLHELFDPAFHGNLYSIKLTSFF